MPESPSPNPVLTYIDAGHYEQTVPPGKRVCRADKEDWPCTIIQGARKAHEINMKGVRIT